jgi:NADH:ubiquinone oxidoreductase subunit 6 (subunit J)
LLFTIFATITVAGAVAAMTFRNLVHSVLALTAAFAGLAAVYLLLSAQFIGLAQILIYVGAVAILVVFAVLLTRDVESTHRVAGGSVGSAVVVLVVFGVLGWAISRSEVGRGEAALAPGASMQQIGNALMVRFALPLEVIGLLLTVALLGAVTIATRDGKGKP